MDRHELYERCVQNPDELVQLLEGIHGARPTALGEDFSGTAAVSRAWLRRAGLRHVGDARAVAVDHDARVLERARGVRGLSCVCGDARDVRDSALDGVDVVFVGNFSIGEIGARAELVAYLARSRARLRPGGVFVCDTYGGASAFRIGARERVHDLGDGRRVRYVWEQRAADPRDARVENALHFRIESRGEIVDELHDAFVYRWRLWSLAELREALLEAGFERVEFWCELARPGEHGRLRSVSSPVELGESWIACVSGHVGTPPR